MAEEYKVAKQIEIILETPHSEVAVYFGAYIDGIHDTCAWITKTGDYGKIGKNQYRWILDLKERLNTSNASEEEIRKDFERQINHGLEHILLNSHKFNFWLQVREIKNGATRI